MYYKTCKLYHLSYSYIKVAIVGKVLLKSAAKVLYSYRKVNTIAYCRWDVQRIREQRQVERLKLREMASARRGSGGSSGRHSDGEEPLSSLWPQLDDAEYLEITESVPVAAFGLPITKFTVRCVKIIIF